MRIISHMTVPNVDIKMGNYNFLVDLIALGNLDIDLILRMDWLSKHKATLDCVAKEV